MLNHDIGPERRRKTYSNVSSVLVVAECIKRMVIN